MQFTYDTIVSGEPIGDFISRQAELEIRKYELSDEDRDSITWIVREDLLTHVERNPLYWNADDLIAHHEKEAEKSGDRESYVSRYPDFTYHYRALDFLNRRIKSAVKKEVDALRERTDSHLSYVREQLEAWPNVSPMILRALADNRMQKKASELNVLLQVYRDGIPLDDIKRGRQYLSEGQKTLAAILKNPRFSDAEYSHLMMHRDHVIPGYVANASGYEQKLYSELHEHCYGYPATMMQFESPVHVRKIGDPAPGAADLAPRLVGSLAPGLDPLCVIEVARDSLGESESV